MYITEHIKNYIKENNSFESGGFTINKELLKQEINKIIKKYSFLELSNKDFNIELDEDDNKESIKAKINNCVSDYLSAYLETNSISTLFEKCDKSITKISNLFNSINYNMSFNDCAELLKNDKVLSKIKKLVDNNIELIKIDDYSFLKNNAFYISLIDFYILSNDLIEEETDDKVIETITMDNSVNMYFKEIARYELLTREKEYEIAVKMKQGDIAARDDMINHNLRLVVSIAKKYNGTNMSLLDLIQEGNLGLIKATTMFEPEKGYKFSTYASWWIRQTISRGIADKEKTIRVPIHAGEKIKKINTCKKELSEKYQREATLEEVAKKLKLSVSTVKDLYNSNIETVSLNQKIGVKEEDNELGYFIADESAKTEDTAIQNNHSEEIRNFLDNSSLTPREKRIIYLRYGIGTNVPMTLQEISNIYGMSRERVRQIELKALKKLRRSRNILEFSTYLDNESQAESRIIEYRKTNYNKKEPTDEIKAKVKVKKGSNHGN